MEEAPVIYKTEEEGIAWIILNRPKRRNAINQSLLAHLYDAIDAVAGDENIRAAILTGNGKSFCSGLDLEIVTRENLFNPREDGKDLMDVLAGCKKPLIGAVNGHAITGGFELALNCDFLIASDHASFADTHAKVGIHPGWGMTQLLQQAIGRRRARQMSYTCQFITAEKAFDWGLVNEVVPHEMLWPRAKELANQIGMVNQDMLATVRDLIDYRDGATLAEAIAHEREGFNAFVKTHLNPSK